MPCWNTSMDWMPLRRSQMNPRYIGRKCRWNAKQPYWLYAVLWGASSTWWVCCHYWWRISGNISKTAPVCKIRTITISNWRVNLAASCSLLCLLWWISAQPSSYWSCIRRQLLMMIPVGEASQGVCSAHRWLIQILLLDYFICMTEWQYIPKEAFLYFPEGKDFVRQPMTWRKERGKECSGEFFSRASHMINSRRQN